MDCDPVMNAALGATHPRVEGFRLIGGNPALRVALGMVDALHVEKRVQRVIRLRFVSEENAAILDDVRNETGTIEFAAHEGPRATVTFTHDGDALTLARLIGELAPITAMLFPGRWLHIPAIVGTIDLHLTGERLGMLEKPKRLAELMKHHESGLRLDPQIAGKLQGADPLRAVRVECDGKKDVPELQLPAGEHRAGRDGELVGA